MRTATTWRSYVCQILFRCCSVIVVAAIAFGIGANYIAQFQTF
jgi:hypothetical protein